MNADVELISGLQDVVLLLTEDDEAHRHDMAEVITRQVMRAVERGRVVRGTVQ